MNSTQTQFWSKTIPVPESGCWLWMGEVNSSGYGIYRRERAHRVAWELFKGEIPDGKFACHKCDVPGCVNPDHLFLGTPRDNTVDMVSKGRHGKHVKPVTHCKHGHELSGDNLYSYKQYRYCKTCRAETEARRRKRLKIEEN